MKGIKKLQAKNVWWIAEPPKRKIRKFSSALTDLLNNTSMHCYGRLVEPDRSFWERLMWVAIHMAAFGALAIVLNFTWRQYIEKPFVTHLQDTLYPVELVQFPAISICSNNRMTKSAATQYAKHLASLDPDHQGEQFFLDNILKMSALYDDDVTNLNDIIKFQNFLDTYDFNTTEGFFNTRRRMKRMTPSCEYLLLNCTIAGKVIPCMSKKTFQMSITRRGYCCVFNVGETDSLASNVKQETNRTIYHAGLQMGLTIILNATTSDYFYKMFDLNGFVVHVYDPSKYDDMTSGVIAERFVRRATESFISIRPEVMFSNNEIRRFHKSTRQCVFKDEFPESYGTQYSFSNCITYCRIRSITRLCGCFPFYMPRTNLDRAENIPSCNLNNVQCLNHYKRKWITVMATTVYNIPELGAELEDGLFCPECLASCSYVRYKLSMSTLPISRYTSNPHPLMAGVTNFSEIAVVNFYYPKDTVWYFSQSLNNPWFQVLSNVGGICGIVTGFSIAALCEFVYFILNELQYRYEKATKKRQQALKIYP